MIQLLDMFNLTNLIKENTCFAGDKGSEVDVILTNSLKRFYNSTTFELVISDVHNLICTSLKQYVTRLKQKVIKYRSTKKFDLDEFRNLLHQKLSYISSNDSTTCDTMYDMLVEATVTSIDYFAPIKTKKVRGNHTRYLRKDLSKAIMNRTRLKNKYNKTLLLKTEDDTNAKGITVRFLKENTKNKTSKKQVKHLIEEQNRFTNQ